MSAPKEETARERCIRFYGDDPLKWPPWRCLACGQADVGWTTVCGRCGALEGETRRPTDGMTDAERAEVREAVSQAVLRSLRCAAESHADAAVAGADAAAESLARAIAARAYDERATTA